MARKKKKNKTHKISRNSGEEENKIHKMSRKKEDMRTGWGIDPATSCLERHSRTIAPHMLSSLKGSYTDFDN